jgi:hypothetical protein
VDSVDDGHSFVLVHDNSPLKIKLFLGFVNYCELYFLLFFVGRFGILNLFISSIHRTKFAGVSGATVMVDFIATESANEGLEIADFSLSHDFVLLLI